MNDYDISSIFNEMQEYLIASMTRNLGRHENWERDEGFNWEAWQALQLEALEDFKRSNKKYVNKNYNTFKLKLEDLLAMTNKSAQSKQETQILKAIKEGFSTRKPTKGMSSAFFRINDRKLNAIFNATEKDLKKASTAMLRMANDQYRSTIYKAQVFANTGTMTVDQAIDMATKDFLAKGINCIEYKNGRRVGIDTYAEMAIRNANKKAYLVGEGTKRDEWGIHTVLVSRYGACSPTCLPWQGKVYIDDVYSGGTAEEAEKTGYPLLSTAIAGGLFHPNCKHIITTYFEGITTVPKAVDVKKTQENSDLVATQRYNERQIRKYKRLENNSLDSDNQSKYKRKRLEWQARNRQLIKEHPEMHRNYAREKVRVNDQFDRFGFDSSAPYSLEERKIHSFGNNDNAKNMKIEREAIVFKNNEGVEFVYPKDYDKDKQIIQPREALVIFESIPKKLQNTVDTVEFLDCFNPDDEFWGKEYGVKNFISFANGGFRKITFWQNGDINKKKINSILKRTYCHEAAHNLDKKRIISNSKQWENVVKLDGKGYPTEYSKVTSVEDFAESVAEVVTNPEKMKSNFPNRYKFITDLLEEE